MNFSCGVIFDPTLVLTHWILTLAIQGLTLPQSACFLMRTCHDSLIHFKLLIALSYHVLACPILKHVPKNALPVILLNIERMTM